MDRIIKTNGEVIPTSPKNGSDYSLEEMQEIVGGYIEIIASADGSEVMVLNEEGKLNELPYNPEATRWFAKNHGDYDYIVGNVLVCDTDHVK